MVAKPNHTLPLIYCSGNSSLCRCFFEACRQNSSPAPRQYFKASTVQRFSKTCLGMFGPNTFRLPQRDRRALSVSCVWGICTKLSLQMVAHEADQQHHQAPTQYVAVQTAPVASPATHLKQLSPARPCKNLLDGTRHDLHPGTHTNCTIWRQRTTLSPQFTESMFKLCKHVSFTRLQVGRHFCRDVHQSNAAAACVLKDRLIYKQDNIPILHSSRHRQVQWPRRSTISSLSP